MEHKRLIQQVCNLSREKVSYDPGEEMGRSRKGIRHMIFISTPVLLRVCQQQTYPVLSIRSVNVDNGAEFISLADATASDVRAGDHRPSIGNEIRIRIRKPFRNGAKLND